MKDVPLGPMTIQKADLFFALLRLFQLLRDVSFFSDADNDPSFTPDMESGGEDDDEAGDEGDGSEVIPPTPFGDFIDEHDNVVANLGNAYGDEFANLFAILATPLLADPVLRDEFTRFALEKFGEEIVFTIEPSPKAKLTLVPPSPPASPPSDPDVPPETPTV